MGTRVDFYILSTSSEEERRLYACRLAEKAILQGNKLHIQTNNEAEAQHLDNLLWSFKDTSFVPHAMSLDDKQPITIGFRETPNLTNPDRIMLNLSDNFPQINSKIPRIVEILPKDGPVTIAGRERYKQYQQQRFEINTHKIGAKT